MAKFAKGVSGCPGGRRAEKPVADALRLAVQSVLKGDPEARSMLRAAAEKIVAKAVAGDVEAFKIIADRLDGKAYQSIELAGDPDAPLMVKVKTFRD